MLLKYLLKRKKYKTTNKSFFYLYNYCGDYMKVYIEFIYIINFLLDFMILYGTKRLLKINKSVLRIIIGSLIGMISTIFLQVKISNFTLMIIKIVLSSLMIISSFGLMNFFKNIFYFYLISIILGGFIYLFDFKLNYYFNFIILLTLSPIIIYLVVRELLGHRINIHNKYYVSIIYNRKTYKFEGFIDTGNRLKSPISNKSVILINKKINYKRVIYVPYKALNYEGVIPCFKPDKVVVNDVLVDNCLVGISKDKFNIDYDCILPNSLKKILTT